MNYFGTSSLVSVGFGTGSIKAIFSASGDFTYVDATKSGLLKPAADCIRQLSTASYDVDVGQARPAVNTGASSTTAYNGLSVSNGTVALLRSVSDVGTVTKFAVYNFANNSITASSWTSPTALRTSGYCADDSGRFHTKDGNWAATSAAGKFYRIDPSLIGKSSNDVVTSSITIPSMSLNYGFDISCGMKQYKDGTMYSPPARWQFPYLMRYYPDQMSASFERIHIPTSGSHLTGTNMRGGFISEDYSKLFWVVAGNLMYVDLNTKTGSYVKTVGDCFRVIRGPDGNVLYHDTSNGGSCYRVNITASLSNPTTTTLGSNPGQSNMGLILGADGRVYLLPYWTSATRLWYAFDPVNASGSANWKPTISGSYNGAGYRGNGEILHTDGCIYNFSQYEKFVLKIPTTGSNSVYGYAKSPYSYNI